MAIYRYLECSTCFITAKDNELLAADRTLLSVEPYEGGFWILANLNDGVLPCDMTDVGYSESLVQIMEQALTDKCDWIKIDRDGDGHAFDDLPHFDW